MEPPIHDSNLLPLEHSFGEALRIYAERLGMFVVVVVVNLLLVLLVTGILGVPLGYSVLPSVESSRPLQLLIATILFLMGFLAYFPLIYIRKANQLLKSLQQLHKSPAGADRRS